MGQKVHPNGLRVGVIRNWNTRWYASKRDFADYLIEDKKIRDFIKSKYYTASISRIDIERAGQNATVSIHTSRPGVLIGKESAGIAAIKQELTALTGRAINTINVNVFEVRNPDACAQLIAENIAGQIEKRVSYRKAMKQSMGRAMKAGAKGIKLLCAGRLGGAEIARSEGYHDGSIPLQTIRADIEYGFAEAHTTYGRVGIKVWIYKGEVLGKERVETEVERPRDHRRPARRNNTRREDRREGGK